MAALARRRQLIFSQHYDQFYWAQRVQDLGIGVSPASSDSLQTALEYITKAHVVGRAEAFATQVRSDGALVAAQAIAS